MKIRRWVAGIVGTALVLALTGCHKEEDARLAAEAAARASQNQQTKAETQAQIKEAKESGDVAKVASLAGQVASQTSAATTASANPLSSTGKTQAKEALVVKPLALENLKKGETAAFGPFEYTLVDIYLVKDPPTFPKGYGFMLFRMRFKNGSPDLALVSASEHFKMFDPRGKSYKVNQQALAARSPQFNGNIKAGESFEGWLGYLVKIQNGDVILQVAPPGLGYANFKVQM